MRAFFGIIIAVMLSPVSAMAKPAACESGEGDRGFTKGFREQGDYLLSLWARNRECEKIQNFLASIEVRFSHRPDLYHRCYDAGTAEALYTQFEWINTNCNQQCINAGQLMGQLQAEIYCGVAPQYPQRTLPVRTFAMCDPNENNECVQAFEANVQNLCAQFVRLAGYRWATESSCQFQ